MSYRIPLAAAGLALLAACSTGEPQVVHLSTVLNATQEVPPTASPATGQGIVAYDRDAGELSWNIAYAGLSGPLQQAHFHGPAAPGAAAGPLVTIPVTASPLTGKAQLSAAQAALFVDGRIYVNLHTAQYPGGEIRGQVTPASTAALPQVRAAPSRPYYAPASPPNIGEPTIRRY